MVSNAEWVERIAVAVEGAGPGALATGRSAAQLWGLRIVAPKPEVWTPGGRALPGVSAAQRHGVAVVDAATMLLLLAPHRSVDDIATFAATADVALDALAARASHWLDARGPHAREVRLLSEHLDGAAKPDSALETRFLQVLDRAALRKHASFHHRIEIGTPPRTVELDLAFPAQRVAVELDGWQYHRSRDSFARDRDRDVHLAALGWVVLRFTHNDVERRPAWVVEQLRRTLRARA